MKKKEGKYFASSNFAILNSNQETKILKKSDLQIILIFSPFSQ